MSDTNIVITAEDQASGTLNRIVKNLEDIDRAASLASKAFGAILGVNTIGAFINFADEITSLNNRLRNVTGSTEEFEAANKAVFDIAKKTSAGVADVAQMYQRLSIAQDQVGLTGAGVAKVTELVTMQMKAAGISGAQASSYLLQLSQAFGSGKLQGDEFRSMMESNPAVMRLVAKEMGVTMGQLKQMGTEGKITGTILRDAFLHNGDAITKAFADRIPTITDGLTNIKNRAMELWQEFDKASGFSKTLGSALQFIADKLDTAIVFTVAFIAAMSIQHLLTSATAMSSLAAAIEMVNAAIAKNLMVILIAAIVAVGYEIYKSIIKPLADAGIKSKDIALYVADNLINAFVQIGMAVGDIFSAIPDVIAAALTPGASVSDALKQLDAAIAKSLTTRKIKIIDDDQYAKFKEIEKNAGKPASAAGPLTKPAEKPGLTDKQKKGLEAFDEEIKKLQIASQYEKDRLVMSESEAGLIKLIAEQKDKLAKADLKMTDAQKTRLTNAYNDLQLSKSRAEVALMLRGYERDALAAGETNLVKKAAIAPLAALEAKYGKEAAEAARDQVEAGIARVMAAENLAKLQVDARAIQAELNSLSVADLDTRQITLAVEKERERLGVAFTDEAEKQLKANIQSQQLIAETLALEKQRALMAGAAMPQTKAQQIETATGAIGRLDPRLAAEQQYQSELAALTNTEFANEALRNSTMEALRMEHANKMSEINKSMLEQQLKQSGVTNAAILDSVRRGQDNIRMMQAGGVQAAMGITDQLGQIFGQLGTFNKDAFNAAKAFNIANAVMNTYMGATKALATYPPPFNFVLAAGVIATGLAQVAAIRSQQYSGKAVGGPLVGGTSYMVGEKGPELFTPSTAGTITPNGGGGGGGSGGVVVNFNIVANDTTGFDQLLNSRKGLITQIISDAQLEKGSR
jgi:tape measure domain-containing protein